MIDLTLHCPVCGQRADMCFDHGDDWKKRPTPLYLMTDAQLRAGVNEFTQDDPPPYTADEEKHRAPWEPREDGSHPEKEIMDEIRARPPADEAQP